MRILIDLQACQSTGSRHRGIGRYSLALARAMVINAGQHDLHLMLSGLFPDTIQTLQQEFADLLPRKNLHIWQAPGPVAELFSDNYWRSRAAELVREQALVSLRPDIVHVSSLFEGSVDDAVCSVGVNGEHLPTAVTLYDLIPLVHEKHYLADDRQRAWYYHKLASLKRADLLLAISESSRQEGLNWLNLPSDRIVNISSAIDAHFQPRSCSDDVLLSLRQRYGLKRPFIMYTGGIDLRKNIESLIRSFAALPTPQRHQYQLAIVCSVQDTDRERLLKIARQAGLANNDLVLTGFVPDDDLPLLYQACELFVFPSWHEGFGLPALEAMACGAPVIAANTSSLPEVIGRVDALFDPRNEEAITAKMFEALSDQSFSDSLRQHGVQQAKRFSWDASAKVAIEAFEGQHERNQLETRMSSLAQVHRSPKPKLAYFSPLPPARSGIADFSAALLPELANHYEIELIVDQDKVEDVCLTANFPIRSWQWFDKHASNFDRVLYNFGNSIFHTHMFEMLERHPGVVVLHDFFLSGLVAHLDLIGEQPGSWSNALYESHGYQALMEKQQAPNLNEIIWRYPCNYSLITKAEGIIVHSRFARQLAQQWYGAALAKPWKMIPHLHQLPNKLNRAAFRQRQGLQDEDFLLCSFGMLGQTKLNHTLLNAWLSSPLAQDPRCHLVFVGQNDAGEYGAQLLKTIKNSNAADRIRITGFTDAELFRDYLGAADAGVQLRALSRGETSYTALDCMANGMATLVNNNGSMNELPEHALIKLHNEFTEDQLREKLILLRNDPVLREELGRKAENYIQEHHSPQVIGRQYLDAIEDFFQTEPASRLHRTISKIAALEPVVAPAEADLIAVAQSLSMNGESRGQRQVLLDMSHFTDDVNSRDPAQKKMISAIFLAFIAAAPADFRIEPVTKVGLTGPTGFRYARRQSCALLGLEPISLMDEMVEVRLQDILVTLSCPQRMKLDADHASEETALEWRRHYALDIAEFWLDSSTIDDEKMTQAVNSCLSLA
jgi:glycosyltransferase involved in cell wall biosynthesis